MSTTPSTSYEAIVQATTSTTPSSSYEAIVQATASALERRDSRRAILAQRIHQLVSVALDAARVRHLSLGDGGPAAADEIRYKTIRYTTGWEEVLCLVCAAGGRVRVLRPVDEEGGRVYLATVRELKAIAKALPAAIAKLLSETQAKAAREEAEADEALASL